MRSLENLGKTLNRKEQRAINGGEFCVIHCLSECYDHHPFGSEALTNCGNECQRIANGGGNNGGSGGGNGGGNGGGDPITGF